MTSPRLKVTGGGPLFKTKIAHLTDYCLQQERWFSIHLDKPVLKALTAAEVFAKSTSIDSVSSFFAPLSWPMVQTDSDFASLLQPVLLGCPIGK